MTMLHQLVHIEELIEELEKKEKNLVSFVKYREPDMYLAVFYALGIFSDSNLVIAEEAMKKGESYMANNYTRRASLARLVCDEVFGCVPEKDYFAGGYKERPDVITEVSHEQLMQVAQFAVDNMQLDESLIQQQKKLFWLVRNDLHQRGLFGFESKYLNSLKKRYSKFLDRPDKMMDLYALLVLLKLVKEIMDAVRAQIAEQEQQRQNLGGFKVKS